MAATSSAPGQETSGQDAPHPPPARSPGQSWRNLGRLAAAVGLAAGGLATLVFGIAIGNAARKRADRWMHGYR